MAKTFIGYVKGDRGETGKSAYDEALEGGFIGTLEEFQELLAQKVDVPEDVMGFVQSTGAPEKPAIQGYPTTAKGERVSLPAYTDNAWDLSDPENPQRLDQILRDKTIQTYTHTKTGSVHELTGPPLGNCVTFEATADFVDGDTWTVNGTQVIVTYYNRDQLFTNSVMAGDMLVGIISGIYLRLLLTEPELGENLLDNWYFPDPINQRGQTEYSNYAYGIDRWFNRNIKTVNQKDGLWIDLTVNTSNNKAFNQRIDEPERYFGKQVAISIMVKENTFTNRMSVGIVRANSADLNSNAYLVVNVPPGQTGVFTTTGYFPDELGEYTGVNWQSWIGTNSGNIKIVAAKFELGSRQTLARKDPNGNWVLREPPPNKALELEKCQRYLLMGPLTGTSTVIHQNMAYGMITIPTKMRITPTLFGRIVAHKIAGNLNLGEVAAVITDLRNNCVGFKFPEIKEDIYFDIPADSGFSAEL